jgi:hypothetical protein
VLLFRKLRNRFQGRRVELIVVNAVRSHLESEDVRFDELTELTNAYAVITEKAVRPLTTVYQC